MFTTYLYLLCVIVALTLSAVGLGVAALGACVIAVGLILHADWGHRSTVRTR
jgi:phosphotransferase system  glucose/maltose/N-acetylglucosamine-specific IIC component